MGDVGATHGTVYSPPTRTKRNGKNAHLLRPGRSADLKNQTQTY